MIQCKNYKLMFENRIILEIEDMMFDKGKLHLFKGENGSGKSSFFRSLVGWIKPNNGEISISGSWTYQAQNFHLFSPKVKDNFELNEKIESWLNGLNLNGFYHFNISKLSGGERQKIALIRTLTQDTDIYLLDEPTSYMDESSKAIVFALIQEELLDKGKTVLLISHDNTDIPIKSGIQYRIINQKIQVEKTW